MNDRYEVGYLRPGKISDLDCYRNRKAEAFSRAATLAASEGTGFVYDRAAHPGKPQTWHVSADGDALCVEVRPA